MIDLFKIVFFIFLCSLYQLDSVFARVECQGDECKCNVGDFEILYINGVFNEYSESNKSLEKIYEIMSDQEDKFVQMNGKNKICLKLLYNESNQLHDLIEAIAQKIREEKELSGNVFTYEDVSKWFFEKELYITDALSGNNPKISALLAIIATEKTKLVEHIRQVESEEAATLVELTVPKLRESILTNNSILVSHSQGNLFTNLMLSQLKNDEQVLKRMKYFANLQIATPAIEVQALKMGGRGDYLLSDKDLVIKTLGKLFKLAPENISPDATETAYEIQRRFEARSPDFMASLNPYISNGIAYDPTFYYNSTYPDLLDKDTETLLTEISDFASGHSFINVYLSDVIHGIHNSENKLMSEHFMDKMIKLADDINFQKPTISMNYRTLNTFDFNSLRGDIQVDLKGVQPGVTYNFDYYFGGAIIPSAFGSALTDGEEITAGIYNQPIPLPHSDRSVRVKVTANGETVAESTLNYESKVFEPNFINLGGGYYRLNVPNDNLSYIHDFDDDQIVDYHGSISSFTSDEYGWNFMQTLGISDGVVYYGEYLPPGVRYYKLREGYSDDCGENGIFLSEGNFLSSSAKVNLQGDYSETSFCGTTKITSLNDQETISIVIDNSILKDSSLTDYLGKGILILESDLDRLSGTMSGQLFGADVQNTTVSGDTSIEFSTIDRGELVDAYANECDIEGSKLENSTCWISSIYDGSDFKNSGISYYSNSENCKLSNYASLDMYSECTDSEMNNSMVSQNSIISESSEITDSEVVDTLVKESKITTSSKLSDSDVEKSTIQNCTVHNVIVKDSQLYDSYLSEDEIFTSTIELSSFISHSIIRDSTISNNSYVSGSEVSSSNIQNSNISGRSIAGLTIIDDEEQASLP